MKTYRRTEDPNAPLYVRFVVRGRTYQWCTKTTDEAKAQERGEAYRQSIIDCDLGTVAKHRGGFPTIAQIIEKFKEHSLDVTPRSREVYQLALLRVLKASNLGPHRTVDVLTASVWQTYRRKKTAGLEGEALASAKRTVNGNLTTAQAMFSKRLMRIYRQHYPMPDLTEWLEQDRFKAPSPRFSSIPEATLKAAMEGCRALGPSYLKVFCLALFGGLRRAEALACRWDWFVEQPDGSLLLRLPETTKSKTGRAVPVPRDVLALLGKPENPTCPYVIPREDNTKYFVLKLTKCLRKAGLHRRKPLHELRKQFGATIATKYGIYAAQRLLGHASPDLTAKVYADLVQMPSPVATPAWAAA